MKKLCFTFCLAAMFLVYGCSAEKEFIDNEQIVLPEVEDNSPLFEKGVVRVKMSAALLESLTQDVEEELYVVQKILSEQINGGSITSLKRLYPYAGKYEARTREMGMHLWYVVRFDPQTSTSRLINSFSESEDVLKIERVPVVEHFASQPLPAYLSSLHTIGNQRTNHSLPFNDPLLDYQWHYKNNAQNERHLLGADINVFPVWENNLTGNPNVIVCVVDQGVDYMHEDLKDNMYINLAELTGNPGEDSDNNGFIDDIYGYNFVDRTGQIVPNDHGSHVAGIIAGVNNNGVGISGIAGGDGTANSGVKILNAQIFTASGSVEGAVGIKYGADNGAVISQNSWGYPALIECPESDKLAIDYFIKYAGVDENDQQVGPIRGGIVVFASGNESRPYSSPGSYSEVVSVTSIAPDYTKAYYSNYGNYATVAAPGGSLSEQYGVNSVGAVLSTVANNRYAFLQGTSMACPHVSGALALLVSKVANEEKQGVTAKEIISQLVENSRSIDNYNPSYVGKMGGLIDVYRAVGGNSSIAPLPVSSFSLLDITHNEASFEWMVPVDEDDANTIGFAIYSSTEPLDGVDFNNLPSSVTKHMIGEYVPAAGEKMRSRIRGLKPNSTYYFAIQSYDFSGNSANISTPISAQTIINNPPIITPREGFELFVKKTATGRLRFDISDPEGEEFSVSHEAATDAETVVLSNNLVTFFVNGSKLSVGSYQVLMKVIDASGGVTEFVINYHIVEESAPEVAPSGIPKVALVGLNKEFRFSWADYITDKDGDALEATVTVLNSEVATAQVVGDSLFILAKQYGVTTALLSVTDKSHPAVEVSFDIECNKEMNDESLAIQMYPNPVRESLNLLSNNSVKGSLKIFSSNGALVKIVDDFLLTAGIAANLPVQELRTGHYLVQFEANGVIIKRNITKL
ncbi:MAG: S8 family serine peptidase [Phocaeicola sp.]